MREWIMRWKKPNLILVAFLLFFSVWAIQPSSGQSKDILNEIRVALFVDTGTGYQNTIPVVSLNSEQPMSYRGESGTFQNFEKANDSRFSLDQFYLIVTETTELSEARAAVQRLGQQDYSASIIRVQKKGQYVFRVVAGSEADYQSIQSLQQQVAQKTSYSPTIAGAFRVHAGTFTSLANAQQLQQQIQQQNVTAYIVQVLSGSGHQFQVWAGDEPNEEAQKQLQQSLQQSLPNMTFNPAKEKEYVIHQETVLIGSQTQYIPYLLISTQSKFEIIPQSGAHLPLITVEEREKRKYRGTIELSRYQNKLTVVNVLPLEEYLYSVVGTEMATGWPLEALKSQAIMSRNYAYNHIQSNTYGVAHLSDSVFEQAYYGYDREADDVRQAVDQTRGQFLTYKGQVFSTFYYSNAGGMTAKGSEVWGNDLEHHSSVKSKDNYPETVQDLWYRIQDSKGKIGYVSSEFVNTTNKKTNLSFTIGTINTSSLNFRAGPSTSHSNIGTLDQGERVIIIEQVRQDNAYSWIAGPYTGQQLQQWINERDVQSTPISEPVYSLKVTEKGPSGRVLSMEANGQRIITSSPNAHRSLFKYGNEDLYSTKFEIDSTGEYTILGAGNKKVNRPQGNQQSPTLHAVQGSKSSSAVVNGSQDQFIAVNGNLKARVISKQPLFRLLGKGFGHGLGASQWGIYGMASDGYDYVQILKHYFHKDAQIEKGY